MKGSRHILQESSEESSKATEEGAEMGGMCVRDEEKEVKFAMVSSTVVCVCDREEFYGEREEEEEKNPRNGQESV